MERPVLPRAVMQTSVDATDEDYEDYRAGLEPEALPLSSDNRASQSLTSPNFQLPAPPTPVDEAAVEVPVVEAPDVAGEKPKKRGMFNLAELPELKALESPYPENFRPHTDDAEAFAAEEEQRDAARQKAFNRIAKQVNRTPSQQDPTTGRWYRLRTDAETGDVIPEDVLDSGNFHTDPKTGEQYVHENGTRTVVGIDQNAATVRKLRDQRADLYLDRRAEQADAAEIQATLQPLRDKMKVYGAGPTKVANQIRQLSDAVVTGTASPEQASQLQALQQQMSDFAARNPHYLEDKAKYDSAIAAYDKMRAQKRARERQIISSLSDEQSLKMTGTIPERAPLPTRGVDVGEDGKLEVAPGVSDVTAEEVQDAAHVIATREGVTPTMAHVSTLDALSQSGVRSVGGKPIADVRAAIAPKAPENLDAILKSDDFKSLPEGQRVERLKKWVDDVSSFRRSTDAEFTPSKEAEFRGRFVDRSGAWGAIRELGAGIWSAIVDEFPEDIARIWRGGDTSLHGNTWADSWIAEQERDKSSRPVSYQSLAGSALAKGLAEGPASIVSSAATSLAGGAVGGATGTAIAGPAGTVPGAVAGAFTSSGAAFYRLAKDQFVEQLRDKLLEQSPGMTDEQWKSILAEAQTDARKYGAAEAVPEAIASSLTGGFGKAVAKYLGGPVVERLGLKALADTAVVKMLNRGWVKNIAGELGEELATETVSQKLEGDIEARRGLRDAAPTWGESFSEIAPQTAVGTLLQTGIHSAFHGSEERHRIASLAAGATDLVESDHRLNGLIAQREAAVGANDAEAVAKLDGDIERAHEGAKEASARVLSSIPEETRRRLAEAVNPGGDVETSDAILDNPTIHFAAMEVGEKLRSVYLQGDTDGRISDLSKSSGISEPVLRAYANQHVAMAAASDLSKVLRGDSIPAARAAALTDVGLLVRTGQNSVRVADDAIPFLPKADVDFLSSDESGKARVQYTDGRPGNLLSALSQAGRKSFVERFAPKLNERTAQPDEGGLPAPDPAMVEATRQAEAAAAAQPAPASTPSVEPNSAAPGPGTTEPASVPAQSAAPVERKAVQRLLDGLFLTKKVKGTLDALRVKIRVQADPRGLSVEFTPDGRFFLNVDPEALGVVLATISEPERAEFLEKAAGEEIIHVASLESVRRDWQERGRKSPSGAAETFDAAFKREYGKAAEELEKTSHNGRTLADATREIYGDPDLQGPALAAEWVRQLTQMERESLPTEGYLRSFVDRILSVLRSLLDIKSAWSQPLQKAFEDTNRVLGEAEEAAKDPSPSEAPQKKANGAAPTLASLEGEPVDFAGTKGNLVTDSDGVVVVRPLDGGPDVIVANRADTPVSEVEGLTHLPLDAEGIELPSKPREKLTSRDASGEWTVNGIRGYRYLRTIFNESGEFEGVLAQRGDDAHIIRGDTGFEIALAEAGRVPSLRKEVSKEVQRRIEERPAPASDSQQVDPQRVQQRADNARKRIISELAPVMDVIEAVQRIRDGIVTEEEGARGSGARMLPAAIDDAISRLESAINSLDLNDPANEGLAATLLDIHSELSDEKSKTKTVERRSEPGESNPKPSARPETETRNDAVEQTEEDSGSVPEKDKPNSGLATRLGLPPAGGETFIGKSLGEIADKLPRRSTAVPLASVNLSNESIARASAEIFKAWPDHLSAADGSVVEMKVPEKGSLASRLNHLIADNENQRMSPSKAAWLPRVPETLQNADIRLSDGRDGTSLFARRYEEGPIHVVVVTPDGIVDAQMPISGGLTTQFPIERLKPSRQQYMKVDWQRNDNGLRQNAPEATPPGSMVSGPRRKEFRDEDGSRPSPGQRDSLKAPPVVPKGNFGSQGTLPLTITPSGNATAIDINERRPRVRAGVKSYLSNVMSTFIESATDVLQRQKNPVAQTLKKALHTFGDLRANLEGRFSKPFEEAMAQSNAGRKGLKRAASEFEQFYRNRENGRDAQAQTVRQSASQLGQKLITLWENVAEDTGKVARNVLKIQVWDQSLNGGAGGYRLIGNLGKKYFPRMLREDVYDVISAPNDPNNAKMRSQLEAALVADGWDPAAAKGFFELNGGAKLFDRNDFFGALEMARKTQLPEDFYEYDFFKSVPGYIQNFARRAAQIRAFGQKLQRDQNSKDLFDVAENETLDKYTKEYLRELKKQVYGIRESGGWNRAASNFRALASGLLLSSPLTTVWRNLVSGVVNTAVINGPWRTIRALFSNPISAMDATDIGIIKGNFLDSEMFAADPTLDVSKTIRRFTSWALKWSGYNASERFLRRHAAAASMQYATDWMKAERQNPQGKLAQEGRRFLARIGVDPAALLGENGDFRNGKETRKFVRESVRESQFGYDIDQVPLWANTPAGRFFYQFGRWGIQQTRMLWNNVFRPVMERVPGRLYDANPAAPHLERRYKAFLPFMAAAAGPSVRIGAAALVTGELFAMMTSALFDRDRDDATLEELSKETDSNRAVKMGLERLTNDIMASGMLGILTQPVDAYQSYVNGARFKNPIEPPSTGFFAAASEAIRSNIERGTPINLDDAIAGWGSDWSTALGQMAPGARQLVSATGRAAALITDELKPIEQAQAERDLANLRRATRRYAREAGLETGGRKPTGFPKSPVTATYDRIQDALLIGDTETAQKSWQDYASKVNPQDLEKAVRSMKASVAGKQPLKVGSHRNAEVQADFMTWARQHLPASQAEEIQRVQSTYVNAARRAGWMQ